MKESGKLALTSILSAITASLCCITPVLALISGASGVASTFSWLESFRPFLLGITILVLVFAWYQRLEPRKTERIQCNCDEVENQSFIQTKMFLGIVTVFSLIMMAFPYYGHIFYPKVEKNPVVVSSENIKEAKFNVNGMTCSSCEEHIKNEVNKLPGIVTVSANSKEGSVNVKFDNSKTSISELEKSINITGYTIIDKKQTK
ncbi:Membrane protein containing heavy metal transport/detoxification domain [Flavobacterium indicum GPTSA100-9 = DSM 17447]|uniref:Mercuric transport protein MerT n=1 Tax=Flavobacterium indicum (strain DSM 17447 / CIP 109464 / GPTSA100-9) TaxID=1094466 RepID=H8XT53_FLAIG|nr:mercuric transport protein MerTP [Flavobacterium indicum]CCG53595.1 Membrane protein containing heavy metal transport/detoxification domain [Flavobacterium indicum GPTSA100-9 = DSM 17447]